MKNDRSYIIQLNAQLQRGDYQRIADLVRCSRRTVEMVLKGERNHDTETGRKIIEITERYISAIAQIQQYV